MKICRKKKQGRGDQFAMYGKNRFSRQKVARLGCAPDEIAFFQFF